MKENNSELCFVVHSIKQCCRHKLQLSVKTSVQDSNVKSLGPGS